MSTRSLSTKSSLDSLRSDLSVQSAPDLLAPAVTGPMVWRGAELENYIITLTAAEIEFIKAAVKYFRCKFKPKRDARHKRRLTFDPATNLPRGSIEQTTFPLPEPLASKLSTISNEVYHGRGVAVLRGLDTVNFNGEESVIAFAGISSYVCPSRATDSYAFQTLSHVRDATHDPIPEFAKGLGLAGSKVGTAMVRRLSAFANVVAY
jgi:hypothetical protein